MTPTIGFSSYTEILCLCIGACPFIFCGNGLLLLFFSLVYFSALKKVSPFCLKKKGFSIL